MGEGRACGFQARAAVGDWGGRWGKDWWKTGRSCSCALPQNGCLEGRGNGKPQLQPDLAGLRIEGHPGTTPNEDPVLGNRTLFIPPSKMRFFFLIEILHIKVSP